MTDHRQPSRLLHIGLWVAGVASFGGLAAMIFIAVNEIRAGRGLDTYRTLWMVEDNWIGFLVFVVSAVVALAVGFSSDSRSAGSYESWGPSTREGAMDNKAVYTGTQVRPAATQSPVLVRRSPLR